MEKLPPTCTARPLGLSCAFVAVFMIGFITSTLLRIDISPQVPAPQLQRPQTRSPAVEKYCDRWITQQEKAKRLHAIHVMHRVLSAEPVQSNIDRILATARSLDRSPDTCRWILSRSAFSNRSGSTIIYVPKGSTDNAALDKDATKHYDPSGNDTFPEKIQMDTADRVLADVKFEPDIVKIDVQGAELQVLQGMRNFLSADRDLLVMAEHSVEIIRNAGLDKLGVFNFMKSLGFKVYCKPQVSLSSGKPDVTISEQITAEQVKKLKLHQCGDLTYVKRKDGKL